MPENRSVTASGGSSSDERGEERRRWQASYPVLREAASAVPDDPIVFRNEGGRKRKTKPALT
jgi:hypothetical protein